MTERYTNYYRDREKAVLNTLDLPNTLPKMFLQFILSVIYRVYFYAKKEKVKP